MCELTDKKILAERLKECDTDYEVIHKEIEESFTFNGVQWAAIEELCEMYGDIAVAETDAERAGYNPTILRNE